MLDLLHADFIQLMARFDEPYRRYLHREFVRAERLSGVLGPRGVGKTTFLLQLIGETPDFLRSTLYVSLDSIHASGIQLYACVFRPIVTAHSEKGVTGDSEVVTGDSDLIARVQRAGSNERGQVFHLFIPGLGCPAWAEGEWEGTDSFASLCSI